MPRDQSFQKQHSQHDQMTFFAWSREHLNTRERIINIPKYLISLTHEMAVPADSVTGRHETLLRGPTRREHDFRMLITISSLLSSTRKFLL